MKRRSFLKGGLLLPFVQPFEVSASMDYNTGNSVPSSDPRDLNDNAKILDNLINANKPSQADRLGVSRRTWHGIEEAFQEFLLNLGYQIIEEPYAAGIEVTARNQVILADGEYWKLSASADLPYTTTGLGMPEGGAFVGVGDAVLRQELQDAAQGGQLVHVSTATGEQTLAEALDSRVIHVDTVADLQGLSAYGLAEGQRVVTAGYYSAEDGGGAEYVIRASNTEPASFKVGLSDGNVAVLLDRVVSPLQVGYKIAADEMTSVSAVDDNWSILKGLISDIKASNNRAMAEFDELLTLETVGAEWYSGRSCPFGFYSDSTTDGATTTDHTASTGSNSPFAVTINESPNAYPAKIESFFKKIRKTETPVRCYNGGFDSQSFANGFGLKHWYNTWFRGTSGANVDWSDVKMIVVGFGTSDSINLNDPGPTMDTYALNLECVVIDAFLRGVQPVLQGPVLTTQHGGETVDYRNSKESLILIESVQKKLCRKYGLEWLSMREPFEQAISNFGGIRYEHLMNEADMVHPGNVGHRVYAAHLVNEIYPAIARLKHDESVTHVFAGHPAYVPAFSEVVSPESRGGLILKGISAVVSDDSYFYSWKGSDDNQKNPSERLIRLPVYVEKPTLLYMNMGHNAVPASRTIQVESCYSDSIEIIGVAQDSYPVANNAQRVWNRKTQVCLLSYGLNIVNVYAGDATADWQLVSFYLADLDSLDALSLGRGTAGSDYWTKSIRYPDNHGGYVRKISRRKQRLDHYYNSADNQIQTFRLTLTRALATGTTYQFMTHFNDYLGLQDSYNLIEITGDDIILKASYGGTLSTINSQNIVGLNAAIVRGSIIEIKFKTQLSISTGMLVQFIVDGGTQYSHTAPLGDLYFDGYGFEAPLVNFISAEHTSSRAVVPENYGSLL